MLEIKDAAIEKLKELLKQGDSGSCLRIFITCCCGSAVAIDLAAKPERGDVEVEKNGLKLYIQKAAAVKLVNATIDRDSSGEVVIKGLPKTGGGLSH